MKNVLMLLAKRLLIPLGLAAAPSAANARIYREFLGFWTSGSIKTARTIPGKEVKLITKIAKSFEDPGLLIKGVTEQLKMKQKNNEMDFWVCH